MCVIHLIAAAVTPYLMYVRYNDVIQRVNIHGGELTNVYSGGVIRGLAFDYRWGLVHYSYCCPDGTYSQTSYVFILGMGTCSGRIQAVTESIDLSSMVPDQ